MNELPSHMREASPERGHAGLWFDKFANFWNKSDEWKREWIESVPTTAPESELLEDYLARQRRLVESCGGRLLHFRSTSRFVSGLGREHPIENGFVWHPTLGTPYLPGSSLKGLVRSWPAWNEGKRAEGPPFGSLGKVGGVIFLDALPVSYALEPDVMTPHYADWYQGGSDVPGDWEGPRPIPFLTVREGATFQFALLPRTRDDHDSVELAAAWLVEALEWLGAGAKTAVGYGRFAETKDPGDSTSWKEADEKSEDDTSPRHWIWQLDRAVDPLAPPDQQEAQRERRATELVRTRLSNLEGDAYEALRSVLHDRYFAKWSAGDTGLHHISAEKLRDEYAAKIGDLTSHVSLDPKFAQFDHHVASVLTNLRREQHNKNFFYETAFQVMTDDDDDWTAEALAELWKLVSPALKKTKKKKWLTKDFKPWLQSKGAIK